MIDRVSRAIVLAVGLGLLGSLASAQQVRVFEYSMFSSVEPGVQCGLYALLAAAHALEHPIPSDELVDGKWFTFIHGQTAADIARAARHFGLQAFPASQLTVSNLYETNSPIILLLDDPRGRNESNHWVTFLGFQENQVVLYDSLEGIRAIALAELISRWSGAGVVVSEANADGLMRWRQIVNVMGRLLPALCFVLVCGGIFGVSPPGTSAKRIRWRCLSMVAAFVLCWVLVDTITAPVSLLTNQTLRDSIRCQNARTEAAIRDQQRISIDEIDNCTIVDARPPIAYAMGHLPGAISIPVYSNCFQIRDSLSAVRSDMKFVVYCQSARCDWASQIAARMECLGYRAYVLQDGVDGWISAGKRLIRSSSVNGHSAQE